MTWENLSVIFIPLIKQKVFRALEEVDRSIEEDKAAELAQRRKVFISIIFFSQILK